MKTIKLNGVVKRVSNDKADIFVKEEGWKFTTKSEWKKDHRKEVEEKPEKKSKKKTKVD